MQYFYIVVYVVVGDDMTMCKIGLNPHQLINWGRREATKHPERTYKLFRQSITQLGEVYFYKTLLPFKPKIASVVPFDWDAYNAKCGADMDSDVIQ